MHTSIRDLFNIPFQKIQTTVFENVRPWFKHSIGERLSFIPCFSVQHQKWYGSFYQYTVLLFSSICWINYTQSVRVIHIIYVFAVICLHVKILLKHFRSHLVFVTISIETMEDENSCSYCQEALDNLAVLCLECSDFQLCLTVNIV